MSWPGESPHRVVHGWHLSLVADVHDLKVFRKISRHQVPWLILLKNLPNSLKAPSDKGGAYLLTVNSKVKLQAEWGSE